MNPWHSRCVVILSYLLKNTLMKLKTTFALAFCGFLLLPVELSAQTNEAPYIIVADDLGNLVKDAEGEYENMTQMTPVAVGESMHYTATIDVPSGKFAVYARDSQGVNATFYRVASWAVSDPIVANYPNPLGIFPSGSGAAMSLPVSGNYTFDFFDRDEISEAYHQLTPTLNGGEAYPSQIYLISGNDKVTVPEISSVPGTYLVTTPIPADFTISYEPRAYEIYEFGPESAASASLENGVASRIGYMENTSSAFHVGTTVRNVTSNCDILVSLVPDNMFIQVTPPGMSGIEDAGAEPVEAEYYTLAGISVGHGAPSEPGIYVKRCGASVDKVVVR